MEYQPGRFSKSWWTKNTASFATIVGLLGGLITAIEKYSPLSTTISKINENIFLFSSYLVIAAAALFALFMEFLKLFQKPDTSSDLYQELTQNMVHLMIKEVNGILPKSTRVTVYGVSTDQKIGNEHYYHALGRCGNIFQDLKQSRSHFRQSDGLILHKIFMETTSKDPTAFFNMKDSIDNTIADVEKFWKYVPILSRSTINRREAWLKYLKTTAFDYSLSKKIRMRSEWYCGHRISFEDNSNLILLIESLKPISEEDTKQIILFFSKTLKPRLSYLAKAIPLTKAKA